MAGDREAGIIGISGLPDFLEPLGDTVSSNDLKEDTRGIMPEESNPKGGVFRRKGTHEVLKVEGEESGLNIGGRLGGRRRDDETRSGGRRGGDLRGSR